MKFLVDAQLPAQLARFLTDAGHDTLHTTNLPHGNRTTDAQIAELADADGRIVVTKDRDFRDSHLLMGSPRRLLVVATGNITNRELLALFKAHLTIVATLRGVPADSANARGRCRHRAHPLAVHPERVVCVSGRY